MTYRISEATGVLTVNSTGQYLTGVCLQGAAITSGLNTLTISTSRSLSVFTSADVGKAIQVIKAGTGGTTLYTTISGFTNSTTVTLTANAGATVSNQTAFWYPSGQDDTSAIQTAINATTATKGTVYLPSGVYVISSTLTSSAYLKRFIGDGLNQTYIVVSSASFTGDMLSINSVSRGVEIVDLAFKHLNLTTSSSNAPITAWSVTSNVATFTATNSYTAGQPIAITGFTGTGSQFNDTFATVLSSGLSSSQFEINFTASNGSGTDNGVAHLDYNCITFSIGSNTLVYANLDKVQMMYAPGDGLKMTNSVVTRIKSCVALANTGDGFAIYNSQNIGSTSTLFENNYANGNYQAGYYLHTVNYCSFLTCASDSNGISYYIYSCKSVSLMGCGSEASLNNNSAYPGYHFYIHGGQAHVLNGCYGSANSGIANTAGTYLVFDNTASQCTAINITFAGSSNLPTNAFTIASGCTDITVWEPYFITIAKTAYTNSGTNSIISIDGALQNTSLTTTANIQVGTYIALGSGTVAASGSLRASSATTIAASRNAANTADVIIIGTTASNSVVLGDGTNANNINLNLPSGNLIQFQGAGNNAFAFTITPSGSSKMEFANTVTAGTIDIANITTTSATGAALTIQAQNATGTTSTGGALILTSGSGTSTNGAIDLQVAGTNVLTLDSTTQMTTKATTQINSGNSKITVTEVIANVSTTTATTTTLYTWTIPNGVSQVDCIITVTETGNVAGGSFKRSVYIRNNAGTVALGSVIDNGTFTDNSSWSATISNSTTTGNVTVTSTAVNLTWVVTVRRQECIF